MKCFCANRAHEQNASCSRPDLARLFLLSIIFPLLFACKVGPNYKNPQIMTPAAFSQSLQQSTSPTLNVAEWWNTFEDSELTSLIGRAEPANLDLKLAEARIREARAARREANSALFPM